MVLFASQTSSKSLPLLAMIPVHRVTLVDNHNQIATLVLVHWFTPSLQVPAQLVGGCPAAVELYRGGGGGGAFSCGLAFTLSLKIDFG